MQNFSFHTHTNFSDGRNSVEEMLSRAVELGWSKIGITDHLIVHKNIWKSPSSKRFATDRNPSLFREDFDDAIKAFSGHRDHIRKIADKYPLQIFVGAEVDFFTYPGWQNGFERFLSKTDLDYCITGNHYLQLNEDVIHDSDIFLLEERQRQKAVVNHFNSMRHAVESGYFLFLAHIDYIRLGGYCTTKMCWDEKMMVIEALQKTGTATELSTKGLRYSEDYYPAPELLNELIKCNIPLIISDDAHRPEELGYKFSEAEEYLTRLNYTNRLIPMER